MSEISTNPNGSSLIDLIYPSISPWFGKHRLSQKSFVVSKSSIKLFESLYRWTYSCFMTDNVFVEVGKISLKKM